MNLVNSIFPSTPRPVSEPRRVTKEVTTKTNATPVAPATVVKKKGGPACKTTHKAVVEQKSAPIKRVEMVDVVDEEGFALVGKTGKKVKVPSPEEKKANK